MRDFILHQAETRDQTYAFPKLRRVLRSWIARRQLRKLSTLDDYLLSDMGLTRDDLRYGLTVAYDLDPIEEVMRAREHRMARGVRRR